MKHATTLITILIIALLVACSAPEQAPADESAQVAQDNAVERDERKDDTTTSAADTESTKPAPTKEVGSASTATAAAVKEFDMTAQQWEFIPNPIEVNKGDKVILHITSKDVTHGFTLPDFDVNERLTAGATTDVEFIADKAGSFTFFCNVQCGSGHSNMKGQLIVR